MRPPSAIKTYVRNFCKSLVADPKLQYLPIEPYPGSLPDECFSNVETVISKKGGKNQYGWAIWEWPKVLIYAEFHAVWVDATGSFHDVTPRRYPAQRILFLADHATKYQGRQIPAVYKPLSLDPQAHRHCQIEREIGLEFNKGELADYHGIIKPSERHLQLLDELAESARKLSARFGRPRLE